MISIPLSDEDWERVSSLFSRDETPRRGRPASSARQVLNAILWVVTRGEKWRHLPSTFPPQQTCYGIYLDWRKSGALAEALDVLAPTTAR